MLGYIGTRSTDIFKNLKRWISIFLWKKDIKIDSKLFFFLFINFELELENRTII